MKNAMTKPRLRLEIELRLVRDGKVIQGHREDLVTITEDLEMRSYGALLSTAIVYCKLGYSKYEQKKHLEMKWKP